jgi:ABC-type nitrate/sulfonate/bicarbonate transport system substrate-binding protein
VEATACKETRVTESVTNPRVRSRLTRALALFIPLCLAVGAAACGGDDGGSDAGSDGMSLTYGDIQGGTGDITWAYINEHDLQTKYDLKLNRIANPVANLYNDFAANRYPVSIGTPDAFASLAARGVPVRMLSVNGIDANFVLAKEDMKVPEDLAGKKVAGVTGSGSFKSFAATLMKATGFDVQKDAVLMPAQSNLAAVTQLLAGTVDAVVIWEADVSTALVDHPELKIVYSASEAFTRNFGATDWSTSFAYRTDSSVSPEVLRRFVALMKEAQEGLQSDPEATDQLGQEVLKSKPGALKMAFETGRQRFDVHLIDEQLAEDLRNQLAISQEYGVVPPSIPDSFFAPLP